eukprot:6457796-Amphidinium_carterae.1
MDLQRTRRPSERPVLLLDGSQYRTSLPIFQEVQPYTPSSPLQVETRLAATLLVERVRYVSSSLGVESDSVTSCHEIEHRDQPLCDALHISGTDASRRPCPISAKDAYLALILQLFPSRCL